MTPSLSAQRTIVKARVTQITAGAACVYPTNHAE